MSSLQKYLEISLHSYEWGEMSLLRQAELQGAAIAELASMRRLIEAVEKWKKIVSNYYINTREDSSLLSAIDKYKEQK